MTAIRLDKRLSAQLGCARGEARRYIEGGWVQVDGQVVEQPQRLVDDSHVVVLAEQATDARSERVSMLLNKPAGVAAADLCGLVTPGSRSALDASGTPLLQRHFHGLQLAVALPADDCGLVVVSQDPRILAHLQQQLERTEQEFLVEVRGERNTWDIGKLRSGLDDDRIQLSSCRISWQSEQRLRYAGKGLHPRLLRNSVAAAGFELIAIRRLRIGRVALGPLAAGQWRYLGSDELF